MNIPTKQNKCGKNALNLNNSTSSNHSKKKKIYTPPENKNRMLSICTPPFCDRMPKGNQNLSSKGGGSEEHRNRAKFARKP